MGNNVIRFGDVTFGGGKSMEEMYADMARVFNEHIARTVTDPPEPITPESAAKIREAVAGVVYHDETKPREARVSVWEPAPPPDPRLAREQRRREIEAVLAEDARRFPAFATARRAAVMAAMENDLPWTAKWAEDFCALLREYEDRRGGGREMSQSARGVPLHESFVRAYERARSPALTLPRPHKPAFPRTFRFRVTP